MKKLIAGFFLLAACLAGLPAQATELFSTGFETGPGTLETIFPDNVPITGQYTIQNSFVHQGLWAFKFTGSGGSHDGPVINIPQSTTIVFKTWWWVPSTIKAGTGNHQWRFGRAQSGNNIAWEIDPVVGNAGDWGMDILFHQESPEVDIGLAHIIALPTDQWFFFEMLVVLNTPGSANGQLKFAVNCAQVYSNTSLTYRRNPTSMNGFDRFLMATNWQTPHSTDDYWYQDEVVVTDSASDYLSGGCGGGGAPTIKLPITVH